MLHQKMDTRIKVVKIFLLFFLISLYVEAHSVNANASGNSQETIHSITGKKEYDIGGIQFKQVDLGGVISESLVYSVLQDHLGFMWFGTQIGLVKYDGYDTTIYRNDPKNTHSLSDDSIYAIHEDQYGDLWIGTRSGGLNRFDRDEENFYVYRHQADDPFSLSHDQVYVIFEDTDGILWVGTRNGLNRFDRKTSTFSVYRHHENDYNTIGNNAVHVITQTEPGMLWVGAGNELDYFDIENETFRHFPQRQVEDGISDENAILSITVENADRFWLGTQTGVKSFDRISGDYSSDLQLPDVFNNSQLITVNTIYKDQHEVLWIGTMNHGLYLMDMNSGVVSQYLHQADNPFSLCDDMILSIYQDAAGNYWIGTLSGINYFDPNARKFHSYQVPSLEDSGNETINAIAQKGNGLWIGTSNSGLAYLNRDTGEMTQYRSDPENPRSIRSNKIWSLLVDRDGILWVGTGGGGLSRFDEEKNYFINFQHKPKSSNSLIDDHITRILQDRTGALWLATHEGLDRFDPLEEEYIHYRHQAGRSDSLSEYRAVALCEDHLGILWIGTWGEGLYALDLSSVEEMSAEEVHFERYSYVPDEPDSLSNNNVYTILEDRNGTLWVGTQGGLNKFHRDEGVFTHYNETDGLPSNIIVGILEDPDPPKSSSGNHLWLSTDGLSRFDTENGKVTNYNTHDGLVSNNSTLGAYFRNDLGEMFFGTTSGVTYFHPDDINGNTYVPPVVLTDFLVFNEKVPINENSSLNAHINVLSSLVIEHKDRVISFKYAALNYTDTEKNQYAYKLEGLENDWNYAGTQRLVTYTTLPEGTYIFRVRGSNNDGVWNEEGTSLEIIVKPPWWRTWWAYGFYGLCLTGVVFGYNHYRIREKTQRVKQLEEEVSERTADLQSKNLQLLREVNERQLAEQNLQVLNQDLENRVNERTQRVRQLSARLAEMEEIERQKIAAELHDQVSQNLVALSVNLEILRNQITNEGLKQNQVMEYIDQSGQVVQQTTQSIRNLMDDLRPPALEEYGLLAAIRWNSAQLSCISQIHIDVYGHPIQPRLSLAKEIALFRIVQEAMINAIHHSKAGNIQIELKDNADRILLVIQDDGTGFDLQKPKYSQERKHRGLQIMAERAESAGGIFRLETAPGKGVTITVEVKK